MRLCWAAYHGDVEEIQRLIACGANLNDCDYDGRSCLHLACCEGHVELVKILLAQHASTTLKDRWGHTPIDDAKTHGHEDIVKLLNKHSNA